MPKPRTNHAAIAYWAESIRASEPADEVIVNSIIVSSDVVYSFGHHFPMGAIVRRANGTAKRVVINSDFYPKRGFAQTPEDHRTVEVQARHHLPANCELVFAPMSGYANGGLIQIRPNPADPEPERFPRIDVDRRFHAVDPGPEPIDDGIGCIAGRVEHYSYQDVRYSWQSARYPYDETAHPHYSSFTGGSTRRVWDNGRIVYGSEFNGYDHAHVTGERVGYDEYKQCPHCREFKLRHQTWTVNMHGGYDWRSGNYRRVKGFARWSANMHAYGGWDGWLDAWRADRDRVQAAKDERDAWEARNFIPIHFMSRLRTNLGYGGPRVCPNVTSDGYPLVKDVQRYFRWKREQDRNHKRDCEQRARQAREAARIERVRARRAQRRSRQFVGRVAQLTNELSSVLNSSTD